MTKADAIKYVRACDEDDGPESYSDAADLFRAIFGRTPTADDGDAGDLWSHVCAAVATEEIEPAPDPADRCQCGEWSGELCQWSGPRSATVLVEYMPEHLRGSHIAAGDRGSHLANGSVRIRCEASCADRMVEHDGEWCEIVDAHR